MRKFLLSTLAAATIVSAGLIASRAAAMAPTMMPVVATAAHTQLQMAAVVCGSNGCGVVQTKGTKQRKLIWLGHG
jgi:hypothetical protein